MVIQIYDIKALIYHDYLWCIVKSLCAIFHNIWTNHICHFNNIIRVFWHSKISAIHPAIYDVIFDHFGLWSSTRRHPRVYFISDRSPLILNIFILFFQIFAFHMKNSPWPQLWKVVERDKDRQKTHRTFMPSLPGAPGEPYEQTHKHPDETHNHTYLLKNTWLFPHQIYRFHFLWLHKEKMYTLLYFYLSQFLSTVCLQYVTNKCIK